MHQLAKKISLLWQRFIFTVVGTCIMFSLGGCGQNWGWYVVNPTTPAGQQNLKFLIDGLYYTIALSLTAICISIIVGLLIALPGLSTQRVPRRRIDPLYPTTSFDSLGILRATTSCRNIDIDVLGRSFGLVDI